MESSPFRSNVIDVCALVTLILKDKKLIFAIAILIAVSACATNRTQSKDDQPVGSNLSLKAFEDICLGDLYIDEERAQGLTIFRPWEYATLIISGELKQAFEAAGVTGIQYRMGS